MTVAPQTPVSDIPVEVGLDAAVGASEHSFLVEEWKVTREQVHLVLQAVWRFEAATIIGLAGFYAWLIGSQRISRDQVTPAFDDLTAVALAMIPAAMSLAVLHRLKIEYSILIRLADYTAAIEAYIFRKQNMPIEGWETYLAKYPGDTVSWKEFKSKYRNAYWVFFALMGFSLTVLATFAWKARRALWDAATSFVGIIW